MRIFLEARPSPSRLAVWLTPVIAALATMAVGFVVFGALGKDPFAALRAFFVSPIATRYGVAELLLKATPLMLIATGLAIGYRANVWNIGAEGQLTLGAIAGGGIALAVGDAPWPSFVLLPAMFIAGAAAGMAWAAIPAWLRTRFNANEILTSLMLVYVASLLLSWLVHGPWRDPEGYNFPQSKMFDASATLPILIPETRLNAAFLLALVIVALAWIFVRRHVVGFEMRVAGLAPGAANYAGISMQRNVWLGMLAGGACAGLAGVGEAAGPIGQLLPSMSPGYGFAAIIVAFVGRLHPGGIALASVLMSLLYLGGESAQVNLGLPSAVTGLFEGTLLFFLLAADVFVNFRLRVVAGAPV
ncbi:MAG TPA: ABC transporter permease [Casimicrobiaceae bacterium]|nr:ABC transporter permease [Casimicrobiaceae bacterium]